MNETNTFIVFRDNKGMLHPSIFCVRYTQNNRDFVKKWVHHLDSGTLVVINMENYTPFEE